MRHPGTLVALLMTLVWCMCGAVPAYATTTTPSPTFTPTPTAPNTPCPTGTPCPGSPFKICPTPGSACDCVCGPAVSTPTPGPCSVTFSGRIIDATTGAGIPAAVVCSQPHAFEESLCATTRDGGEYDHLCYRGQTSAILLCARAPGHQDLCIPHPTTPSGQNETQSFALLPFGAVGCIGDCNGFGAVTVDEIILMVNIALGQSSAGACAPVDLWCDAELGVTVDCIVEAVINLLQECFISGIGGPCGGGVTPPRICAARLTCEDPGSVVRSRLESRSARVQASIPDVGGVCTVPTLTPGPVSGMVGTWVADVADRPMSISAGRTGRTSPSTRREKNARVMARRYMAECTHAA